MKEIEEKLLQQKTYVEAYAKITRMNVLDKECNLIFLREFKDLSLIGMNGILPTFETIKNKSPDACGFTFVYLSYCKDLASKPKPSVDVKQEVVIELAKYDLQRGATIAEIIFSCCQFLPVLELINKFRVHWLCCTQ